MALAARSKSFGSIAAKPAPRQPDYKAEKDGITVSVWEDVKGVERVYTIRCQRTYVDGRLKTQFTDSFEFEHLETLMEMLTQTRRDIEAEMQSQDEKGVDFNKLG